MPTASLPIYDRELSLSANSSVRDAGMLAYIGVNGSLLPVGTGSRRDLQLRSPTRIPTTPSPTCFPCSATNHLSMHSAGHQPRSSKGVMANDVNVYGVALSTHPSTVR